MSTPAIQSSLPKKLENGSVPVSGGQGLELDSELESEVLTFKINIKVIPGE